VSRSAAHGLGWRAVARGLQGTRKVLFEELNKAMLPLRHRCTKWEGWRVGAADKRARRRRRSRPCAPRARSSSPQGGDCWAERIAELTLDPWRREVLLSAAPRLLLNATRQSGKSTAAALRSGQ